MGLLYADSLVWGIIKRGYGQVLEMKNAVEGKDLKMNVDKIKGM